MSQRIVIVGGGQAAASFAARLRQNDTSSEVVMIADEGVPPYQRPPLSKKYATGEMDSDQLQLRSPEWYADNHVSLKLGLRVAKLDPASKSIVLSGGEEMGWDKLMIATGSRPRRLPAAIGGNAAGVYCLRSIDDADEFADELVSGRHVVIVGGGYIGLEAAAVCAQKGLDVTLVEASERILQRVASPETSDAFRLLHETHGVKIFEATQLDHLAEQDGRVKEAVLTDGNRVKADFVLVGIGIVPNVEFAEGSGLKVDGGVVVDSNCRTSDPDIYAAGDCTVFQFKGEATRLESVQNAIDQAECAADNMTGNARDYVPYPWFWSDQYDVKLQIAGLNRGYDEIVVRPGERDGALSHFYFRQGEFLAVDSMNDPRTYMVCKKLLETGKSITVSQASDAQLQLKSLL